MRKSTVDLRDRIATRAYYLWLAGTPGDALAHWLVAETVETALAERRTAKAANAAKARWNKPAAPSEMLVAATKRPALLERITAH